MIATGVEKVAVCQPLADSLVKVTVASFVPVLDHSEPYAGRCSQSLL